MKDEYDGKPEPLPEKGDEIVPEIFYKMWRRAYRGKMAYLTMLLGIVSDDTKGRKKKTFGDVLHIVEKRDELGQEKYGTRLETNNGRDAYRDALDELGDFLQYATQLFVEGKHKDFKDLYHKIQAISHFMQYYSDVGFQNYCDMKELENEDIEDL